MSFKIAVYTESPISGPTNPAICDFHFGSTAGTAPLGLQETAARVVAFMAQVVANYGEANVIITEMRGSIDGTLGYANLPFPTTEYGALRTAYATHFTGLVPMAAYGVSINGSANVSSGRGDSICMPLKGVTAGRSHQGRIFLPFLSSGAISNGLIAPSIANAIKEAYGFFFQELHVSGVTPDLPDAQPSIWSSKLSIATDVLQPSVTQVPSRLRSRTK